MGYDQSLALLRRASAVEVFSDNISEAWTAQPAFCSYTFDAAGDADIQARMFAPLFGVPEDPATGSANVALAGFLASLRPEPDLMLKVRIAQGVDMGRPSLLEAAAEKKASARSPGCG